MTLSNNPNYIKVFHSEVHNIDLYGLSAGHDYHVSRLIAASAVDRFAASGITSELLKAIVTNIKEVVNTQNNATTLRTDVGTLCDNLLYRMAYPCDENAAIRLGCIYTFIEGESPDVYSLQFTQQKERLATGDALKGIPPDPDLYAFFLTLGISSMPAYQNLSEVLNDMDYLENRRTTLESLIPQR